MHYLLLLALLHFNAPTIPNDAEGTICVWAHESIKNYETSRVLELKVYIDGKWIGMLNKAFAQSPGCELPGVLRKKIKAGKHTIEVKGIHSHPQNHDNQLKVNWKGKFVLKANAYIALEIGNHDTPKLIEKKTDNKGSLSVWLDQSVSQNVRDIKVYIDGKYQGRLKKGFNQERVCGDKGTINKKLNYGVHQIKVIGIKKGLKANDPKRKFEFSKIINLSQACFSLPIYFSKSKSNNL